ncbi:MAG: S8 family peptidase [Chloroherpetonaceae bacterium]|nr:S8 family peptidase [Chloroherpetonaceae bacterium]
MSVIDRNRLGGSKVLATRLLALLATLLIACHALASELRTAQLPVPGRYIVVLKDAQDYPAEHQRRGQVDVASTAAELAGVHGLKVDLQFQHALRGFAVSDAKRSTIEALLKDPRVSWIEEDGEVFAFQTTQPNATWGLDRIDQRDLPLNGNYVYNTTASNVRAYIIDTGIRASHNEFGGRVLSGYTAINDGQGSNDCNGHGTHVAGTVGGSVYGVAKQARLVPVRVLNCQGSGTNSGVIAGIDWVAANHVKPAVANMSLGGGASSAVDTAVNNLINAGVTVVVAAGNENQDACNVSPARVANAVTVGSTTSTDARSSFSNWGTCVNIFAPGSSITAAWHTSDSATNTISGTSMASPHVAGVAALYLAANPSATPATVRNALYSTASQGKLTSIGTGSPNLLVYSLLTGGGGGGGGGGGSFTVTVTDCSTAPPSLLA